VHDISRNHLGKELVGQSGVPVSTPCGRSPQSPIERIISAGFSSDKSIRGNVLGDYRARRDDRILTHGCATDDGRAGCDPYRFSQSRWAVRLRRRAAGMVYWMACRDVPYVRPDHHIVCNVEAAKVIESAVLILRRHYADADFGPIGSIKWRDQ